MMDKLYGTKADGGGMDTSWQGIFNRSHTAPVAIRAEGTAAPGGHYSQAVVHNGTAYVAGMLPIRADGSKELGSLEDQAAVALNNLKTVVEASGSSLEDVVHVRVYIVDVDTNWPKFNGVYGDFFGQAKPARAVVPVPNLHYGFLVEVECVAAVRGSA
eukprot:CAMPEP_0204360520 /NCGR_PEP_ID=MMETSP0469-20131031/38111_1 /ASSEMBLY_ACC=CAM_ASM_000384 /TAXON_ID=2969 /ORGANISM="Oxyrrhis marina" /LENGTH=157 /DNA_ID=CAMNT_0051348757 /DNA_START=62 /DNA_END=535 /DNA_ORIENTATION=-